MEQETTNMFERASRLKLRFATPQGVITAEDLWDLPLTSRTGKANLDDVARHLHGRLRDAETESFVSTSTSTFKDDVTPLQFTLVKYVIDVRLAEVEAIRTANERREHKRRIMEILDRKAGAALEAKSEEELRAELAAL